MATLLLAIFASCSADSGEPAQDALGIDATTSTVGSGDRVRQPALEGTILVGLPLDLREPLSQISRDFKRENRGVSFYNLPADTIVLASAIAAGESSEVFISDSQDTLDVLTVAGRIDGAPQTIAVKDGVTYQAMTITESHNPIAARAFLDYLTSQEAREIFQSEGFETP